MLAGRLTSSESILAFFERENIVSPPQNRLVCDGLVTALCTQLTSRNAVREPERRCSRFWGGSQAGPRRTVCRLSGSRWRHPAAAAVRQYPFLKTLFADSAIRAAIPTGACRYPVRHPGADHKPRPLSASHAYVVMSRLQSALSVFVFVANAPLFLSNTLNRLNIVIRNRPNDSRLAQGYTIACDNSHLGNGAL
jgi:hypothetical protein